MRGGSTRPCRWRLTGRAHPGPAMRLARLTQPSPLPRFRYQMWIFERDAGLPPGDLRTAVPVGRTRLMLPLRAALAAPGHDRA